MVVAFLRRNGGALFQCSKIILKRFFAQKLEPPRGNVSEYQVVLINIRLSPADTLVLLRVIKSSSIQASRLCIHNDGLWFNYLWMSLQIINRRPRKWCFYDDNKGK